MALTNALLDITPLRSSPPFRKLWIGGLCSALGSQMTVVAVLFQVWETTGSVYWTGAVGLAHALPVILFGLFAGALVDRHDRRRLYLMATGGLIVCAVLLAVQGFTGGLPIAGLLRDRLPAPQQSSRDCGSWRVAGRCARRFSPTWPPWCCPCH